MISIDNDLGFFFKKKKINKSNLVYEIEQRLE